MQHSDTEKNPPSSHTPAPGTPSREPEQKEEGFFTEVMRFSLIALLIVLPLRVFVAQPFIVSGASMADTFENGEYLMVDQISYRFQEPAHGDVVIFRYPKDPSKYFIKRIIATPGDTIQIEGSAVTVHNKNNEAVVLNEPYIEHMSPGAPIDQTLGPDEYFVMGDNRDASADSRTWGVVDREKIVGRAFLRLFPITHFDIFPGAYELDEQINP